MLLGTHLSIKHANRKDFEKLESFPTFSLSSIVCHKHLRSSMSGQTPECHYSLPIQKPPTGTSRITGMIRTCCLFRDQHFHDRESSGNYRKGRPLVVRE